MKSIALYISAVILGGSLLFSCDTIENPYPVTEPRPSLTATQALDSAEAALDSINGPVKPVQKVLLEDYTGHKCGNCPSGAMKARDQKAAWGDRLVVMAVHAGYFAKYKATDTAFFTNWTTPEGEAWNTSFGVAAYPAGMINRAPIGGATYSVQGIATWPASIAAQMAETPQIAMTITTLYDAATRRADIKVRSRYLGNLTGKYNLVVGITEDGVVDWQENYSSSQGGDPAYSVGKIRNYVHPHAMRKALTGTWGRTNKENPKANEVTNEYFTVTLDNAWKAEKCSVVAFIIDEATREVIQVEEVHLKE